LDFTKHFGGVKIYKILLGLFVVGFFVYAILNDPAKKY
jgi:hypothetical protein